MSKSISLPEAPKPTGRKIFDPRTKSLRLADETGALPPVATVEAMIGKINNILSLFGFDPMPDDTTEENVLPRLQEFIDVVSRNDRKVQASRMADADAVNRVRAAAGLPPVARGSRLLAGVLSEVAEVIERVPAVKARGKMLAAANGRRGKIL
jgi:hypothetical protein